MAKLKFEDAEKAYQAGEYDKTLSLVTEVEKMLNGTSPKTMYLRILASEKKGISDFATLSALRKNCSEYLNKYGTLQELEDQYREVYEVQKRLDQFPATKEAFDEVRQNQAQELERQKQALALREKMAAYVKSPVKLGMKREEIPSSVMLYMRESNWTKGLYSTTRQPYYSGVKSLSFDSSGVLKSYEYVYSPWEEDYPIKQIKAYHSLETDFITRFKVAGAVESTAQSSLKDSLKYADHLIWETDYQRVIKSTYTNRILSWLISIRVQSKYKINGHYYELGLFLNRISVVGKRYKTEDYYTISEIASLLDEPTEL
jgi:cell fate (sporulation/competence/biofilm development) regulator YlbF (YheA/YmcA/DUF963 family)